MSNVAAGELDYLSSGFILTNLEFLSGSTLGNNTVSESFSSSVGSYNYSRGFRFLFTCLIVNSFRADSRFIHFRHMGLSLIHI